MVFSGIQWYPMKLLYWCSMFLWPVRKLPCSPVLDRSASTGKKKMIQKV